jgi:hemerythrin-like domain-containing protein
MQDIIDQLHQDHANFAKVLRLLDEQAEILRSDGSPDYTLMRDIVDYFANYSDLFHHPSEDVVFKVYRQHHHDLDDTLDRLMAEHGELRALTRELYDTLEGIQNTILPKAILANELSAYLHKQHAHMDLEEIRVYPQLDKPLTPQELQEIKTQMPTSEDPLFGEEVQEEYETLYRRITDT